MLSPRPGTAGAERPGATRRRRCQRRVVRRLGHGLPRAARTQGYVGRNSGWVGVGTDHDTASFAVETLRRWWLGEGRFTYEGSRRLLVCADGGGSNDYRSRYGRPNCPVGPGDQGDYVLSDGTAVSQIPAFARMSAVPLEGARRYQQKCRAQCELGWRRATGPGSPPQGGWAWGWSGLSESQPRGSCVSWRHARTPMLGMATDMRIVMSSALSGGTQSDACFTDQAPEGTQNVCVEKSSADWGDEERCR